MAATGTGKHLYKRGWLGLIPLVGAFAGAALIALGIFRYRDRKLALIGAAGCLFTVLIYSAMFWFFFRSQTGREEWSEMAKKELRSLVKDIEFYKLQYGVYPDSLEQLNSRDDIVWIHDPLSPGSKAKFNYIRIGSRYKVFSSGLDNLPGTGDDLYPGIIVPDSSKIGLIY
jgi:hypothetical protein